MFRFILASFIATFSFGIAEAKAEGDEEKAIAEIERLGGVVSRGGQAPNRFVDRVYFLKKAINDEFRDAQLLLFRSFPKLRIFILQESHVTDAGLKQLEKHVALQYLHLGTCEITDDGLKELRTLKNLSTLTLINTNITDAGLRRLKNLPKLRDLSLGSHQITDGGLKDFAR